MERTLISICTFGTKEMLRKSTDRRYLNDDASFGSIFRKAAHRV